MAALRPHCHPLSLLPLCRSSLTSPSQQKNISVSHNFISVDYRITERSQRCREDALRWLQSANRSLEHNSPVKCDPSLLRAGPSNINNCLTVPQSCGNSLISPLSIDRSLLSLLSTAALHPSSYRCPPPTPPSPTPASLPCRCTRANSLDTSLSFLPQQTNLQCCAHSRLQHATRLSCVRGQL